MHQALLILQIICGILTVILVVIQAKGGGIGSTFGGDMGIYSTKRGAEKMLFIFTIIVATIFFTSSLLSVIFPT